jgi:hypothetical protein
MGIFDEYFIVNFPEYSIKYSIGIFDGIFKNLRVHFITYSKKYSILRGIFDSNKRLSIFKGGEAWYVSPVTQMHTNRPPFGSWLALAPVLVYYR